MATRSSGRNAETASKYAVVLSQATSAALRLAHRSGHVNFDNYHRLTKMQLLSLGFTQFDGRLTEAGRHAAAMCCAMADAEQAARLAARAADHGRA